MSSKHTQPGGQPSAAIDVTFSSLTNRNGESSSQAESASSGYRSSHEQKRGGEGATTIPALRTDRQLPDHHDGVVSRPHRSSGGFLLDSSFANSSPRENTPTERHGKRKAEDGYLHVGKTRHTDNRLSVDSSLRGSPLSREVSMDDALTRARDAQQGSRPPSMDPAQLVQMALELSESRKRVGSGSLRLPVTLPRASRGASGPNPDLRTVRPASSSAGQRTSYPSEDERRPRTSDDLQHSGLSNVSSAAHDVDLSESIQPLSPATVSRVDKARQYFELASEHRRLLQHLPPLKPDSSAPGNYTFVSTSSPGSAHVQINRVPSYTEDKHRLGRAYNPLQSLRNRRLRTRERRQLTAPLETWQDTQVIAEWVDDVEAAAREPSYRRAPDVVRLPQYVGDQEMTTNTPTVPKRHRRTDTSGSVTIRPENGWSIEPSELLADVYWTEKDNNKAIIENRVGSNIFLANSGLSVEPPRLSQELMQKSRQSEEVIRRPRQSVEVVRNGEDKTTSDNKKEQRRKLLIPGRHKQRTRSASASSASSTEGKAPAHLSYSGDAGVENTGPLERHMQQMIAKDRMGEPLSPDLVSPDHWESQHTQFPIARDVQSRNRSDTIQRDTATLSVNTQAHHRRAKSADGRVGGNQIAASSVDDSDSAKLRSPVVAATYPPLDTSNQPAERKSKLHRLPLFRNHSKEQNNIERTDFATVNENRLSVDQPRSSQESARPSFVQRHKTAESFTNSLHRHGTSTTDTSGRESGSGVGRFLKGGRIGDLVRTEGSRLSDRLRTKDRVESDEQSHDMFGDPESDEEMDTRPSQTVDNADEPSPRTSMDRKPKYFLSNLPTFKSSIGRSKVSPVQTPLSTTGSDPIGHQQRARKEAGRSARFDRLAPPRINLPDKDDSAAPEDITNNSYIALDDSRKSYGSLGTGSKAVSRTSVVSYDSQQQRMRRTGSMGPEAYERRHWSISDRLQPQQSAKVTRRDVARVRALLLSSGVKAREIQRQADTVRDVVSPVAVKAAEFVGQSLDSLARKDELMVAARMLSSHLDSSFIEHERCIEEFHSGTAKSLASQLDELQRKAVEELTKQLHETSDEADAFTVELTTKGPQDVKRVDDAIDDLLRQRRRQFRLVRRAGFKLLEWMVLAIMWWVWFVVVVFKLMKRSIMAFLAFLKWLLWF